MTTSRVEIINGDHEPPQPFMIVDGQGLHVDFAKVDGELWHAILEHRQGWDQRHFLLRDESMDGRQGVQRRNHRRARARAIQRQGLITAAAARTDAPAPVNSDCGHSVQRLFNR
jgi:hypothetical protein